MKRPMTGIYRVVLAVLLLGLALPGAAYSAGPLTGVTICLDPGHGGADPGAVNPVTGLRESDINLDESYAIKALLEADGAAVVLARSDDTTHSNADRYNFCNEQAPTLIISVHTNSVATPDANGGLVLYYLDDDRALAQAIFDVMYPTLQAGAPGELFTDFGIRRYRAAILRRTNVPAALVEPAFISHPAEAARLAQPIYADLARGVFSPGCAGLTCRRGQIARSVYEGIVSYLRGDRAAPSSAPAVPLLPLLPAPATRPAPPAVDATVPGAALRPASPAYIPE